MLHELAAPTTNIELHRDAMICAVSVLEQGVAKWISEGREYSDWCQAAADASENWSFRDDELVGMNWVVVLQGAPPLAVEIWSASDNPAVRFMTTALALLLHGAGPLLSSQIASRKCRRAGATIYILAEEEWLRLQPDTKSPVGEEMPVTLAETMQGREGVPEFGTIIVSSSYFEFANWRSNPGNKAFVYAASMMHDFLMRFFAGLSRRRNRKTDQMRRRFIAEVFGLRPSDQTSGRTGPGE
jgi:hypothetical protein